VIIGVPKETCPGENRVGLIPQNVAALTKLGRTVVIEAGAGIAAGHSGCCHRDPYVQV